MASTVSLSSTGAIGVSVAVYGLAEMERALKAIEPEARKALDSSIRGALSATVVAARGRLPTSPMSGWGDAAVHGRTRGGAGWPGWDLPRARAGISVRRGTLGGRRQGSVAAAWRVQSNDASAVIFDQAKVSHSPRGAQFVANLDGFGKAQRVLWPAWLATRTPALAQVQAAIDKAEARVQARADAIDARAA